MNRALPLFLLAGAVLAGCASKPEQPSADGAAPAPAALERSCDSARVQGLIGQPASVEMAEQARVDAGANFVRVLGPRDAVTLEYDSRRLNLEIDEQGRVLRATCG